MNIFLGIAIALSSMLLYCESAVPDVKSPIKMCTKSDFSLCVDVPFPNGCVNLNTVNITGAGKSYIELSHTVQAIVITDVDSNEEKCIVLFDGFYCQGTGLILNGNVRPAVILHNLGFANRAISFRQCSKRLYAQLRDNPTNNDRNTENEIEVNRAELNEAESNNFESNHAEPNEAVQNDAKSNEDIPNEPESNKDVPNEAGWNEVMPNELLPWPIQRDNELKIAESLAGNESNDQKDFVAVV